MLYISKTVTDIYLKQVTVEQHMKEMYYLGTKKLLVKKAPTFSNQQLASRLYQNKLHCYIAIRLYFIIRLLQNKIYPQGRSQPQFRHQITVARSKHIAMILYVHIFSMWHIQWWMFDFHHSLQNFIRKIFLFTLRWSLGNQESGIVLAFIACSAMVCILQEWKPCSPTSMGNSDRQQNPQLWYC